MIRKLCEIESEQNLESLLKILESYLKSMTRLILIMRGNNEEVNKETKKFIENMMIKLKQFGHKKIAIRDKRIIFGRVVPSPIVVSRTKEEVEAPSKTPAVVAEIDRLMG